MANFIKRSAAHQPVQKCRCGRAWITNGSDECFVCFYEAKYQSSLEGISGEEETKAIKTITSKTEPGSTIL